MMMIILHVVSVIIVDVPIQNVKQDVNRYYGAMCQRYVELYLFRYSEF